MMCEKESYSFSGRPKSTLVNQISSCKTITFVLYIPAILVTKYQSSTILKSQITRFQIGAILGSVIRPTFAEPVTYTISQLDLHTTIM